LKTTLTLSTLALLAGCATPYQPLPIAQDTGPTPQEACLDVSTAFSEAYREAIPQGQECLKHSADSVQCNLFKFHLQLVADSGIQEALVSCLQTGLLSQAQSEQDRHIPLMDQVYGLLEKQAAREKKAGL
jgi:hypothetical protein